MRTPIETIRRRELAEAAYETVREYGLAAATVSRVAKRAGMSPGLVHHYFESKADLLEAAMRQTTGRYRAHVLERVRAVDTPRAKLDAVIEAQFPPDMFREDFARAWLSFCGEAAFSKRYARVQRLMFRRMQSNLVAYLRPLLPADRVRDTARTLSMLSHGIWLRCALDAGGIDREEALALMFSTVDSLLAPQPARLR